MENLKLKQILIDECRKTQLKIIENSKLVMDDAQQSANDYGTPRDRYDSYRSQLLRKKDMIGQQMEKSMKEIAVLEKIDIHRNYDNVGFGAIVITENQNIFVSISAGKIEVEGKTYFAISPMVPFYISIKDKKKGDEFEFRGIKNKILDIF
ncbi:MAG: hypothetical protein K9J13_05450 [Saprospiraceae bacterium]|nr:hypothetical protein [Saprospiraceae bacterium]